MYNIIAWPLEHLYELWPNYAGAITLLTLLIMVLLLPLTLKGTRSMLAMQKLQPEMKKLQAKHRDDRQRLNEEMMKFYKENNINPMSGCLPLLLQTPVFIFLYRTLYQLINRAPYGQDMGAAAAYGSGGRTGAAAQFHQFGYFQPKHLSTTSRLYQDLSHTRSMRSFGINLAESAQKAVSGHSLSYAVPFIVLVLGVTATSYYQQRQIAGRNPEAQQANPQQAMLMKIMPLFFAFISFTLPAGVVVYFFVSNVFRIGQQGLITRTMYHDADGPLATTGRATDKTSAKVPAAVGAKPKGFLASMKELSQSDAMPDLKGTRRAGGQGAAKATGSKPAPKGAPARNGKPGGAKSTGSKSAPAKAAGAKKPATNAKPAAPKKPAASGNGSNGSASSNGGDTSTTPPARPSRSAPAAQSRPANKKKRK